jgi:hypothetical protein
MPMKRRQFAEYTRVPVDKTRNEIESTLARYGATRFAYFNETARAIVIFEASERRIRFDLPLPDGKTERNERNRRQKWRALLLAIKAKLQSVESKIETFEEAFLAHVIMPDGRSVAEHALPAIAASYKSGEMQALLPPPRKGAA